MADADSLAQTTALQKRLEAVERLTALSERLFRIGRLDWDAVMDSDARQLALNHAFRRQLESIQAAVLLNRSDLGHLAVGFIRPALEEFMYLTFLLDLDKAKAQRLILIFGRWDGIRSLQAQRSYVGDEVMESLWYPREFLERAPVENDEVRSILKELQKEFGWAGGLLPTGAWIAERADQRPLYDYLHAASSRALHFSAGEVLRRSWGTPGESVVTDKPEFREHLADFALHQLVLLFFELWSVLEEHMDSAGIELDPQIDEVEIDEVVARIATLGQVPLVHAAEWNLTPDGPLRPPSSG